MRNRLLSSNGRPGEALRSCQDAGAGGAGIADVWDSAKDPATEVSSRPFSYWAWGFTAMAVNRAVSSHLDRSLRTHETWAQPEDSRNFRPGCKRRR